MEKIGLRQDIQALILKQMLDTLEESEREELDRWRQASEENETVYQWLMKRENHEAEYHFRQSVDVGHALQEMRERVKETPSFSLLKYLKYAAAIALVVVAGATLWYYQYTKVTPPEISEEILLAMQKSEESGRQASTIEKITPNSRVQIGRQTDGQSDVQDDVLPLQALSSALNVQCSTDKDKEFFLTLDDGTLVHLNYDTRLFYPEKFGKGERRIILDGEAYFMVAKDKSRPFIVQTTSGNVKVYGTEFNVNTNSALRSASPTLEVVLVEGSVSVTPTKGKEQMMKPGQQLSLSNSQVAISEVDVAPYLAWNKGFFAFHEWPLKRIMEVLAHWYGKEVEFADNELEQMKLSGNFYRYNDVQPTIQALETVTQLTIKTDKDKIIVEN